MTDEKEFITFEEAIELMVDDEYVHTFRNPAGIMLGADHDRSELLEKMKRSKLELAGEMATAMKHGIVLIDDNGPLFIATKEQEVPHGE